MKPRVHPNPAKIPFDIIEATSSQPKLRQPIPELDNGEAPSEDSSDEESRGFGIDYWETAGNEAIIVDARFRTEELTGPATHPIGPWSAEDDLPSTTTTVIQEADPINPVDSRRTPHMSIDPILLSLHAAPESPPLIPRMDSDEPEHADRTDLELVPNDNVILSPVSGGFWTSTA